jgi:hypothetical protein
MESSPEIVFLDISSRSIKLSNIVKAKIFWRIVPLLYAINTMCLGTEATAPLGKSNYSYYWIISVS